MDSPLRLHFFSDVVNTDKRMDIPTLQTNYLIYLGHLSAFAKKLGVLTKHHHLINILGHKSFTQQIFQEKNKQLVDTARALTQIMRELYDVKISIEDDETIYRKLIADIIFSSLHLTYCLIGIKDNRYDTDAMLFKLRDMLFSARDYFHHVSQKLGDYTLHSYLGAYFASELTLMQTWVEEGLHIHRDRLYLRQFLGAFIALIGVGLIIAACATPALPAVAVFCMIFGGPLLIACGAKVYNNVHSEDKALSEPEVINRPVENLDRLSTQLFQDQLTRRFDTDIDINDEDERPRGSSVMPACF